MPAESCSSVLRCAVRADTPCCCCVCVCVCLQVGLGNWWEAGAKVESSFDLKTLIIIEVRRGGTSMLQCAHMYIAVQCHSTAAAAVGSLCGPRRAAHGSAMRKYYSQSTRATASRHDSVLAGLVLS